MSWLVPKEVGQFFARATASLDGVDKGVADLRILITNANAEILAWKALRERVQKALSPEG